MMALQTNGYAVSLQMLLSDMATVEKDIEVNDVCVDARQVASGGVFLAIVGHHAHGLQHVKQAFARGVKAVVYDPRGNADGLIKEMDVPEAVQMIAVPSLAEKLSKIASRFYDEPSKKMSIIGVTGTNGKTSMTQFLAHCQSVLAMKTASIGTLGWGFEQQLVETENTTPDAVSVQAQLSDVYGQGAKSVAMEVSSHGLVQGRVNDVSFEGAVFTNLSHDHLDYHGTMEAYGQAKLRLFQMSSLKFAVINLDDPFSQKVIAQLSPDVKKIGVTRHDVQGVNVDVLVKSNNAECNAEGVYFDVEVGTQQASLQLSLYGAFNINNALLTIGALIGQGFDLRQVVSSIKTLKAVEGRMQRLTVSNDAPTVLVDYAHTPDALDNALQSLKSHCQGQLTVVFGCGGERDKQKRSVMGRIAEQHADVVIVTNDNPRSETPETIVEDILSGFEAPQKAQVIFERAEAIQSAIDSSEISDVVLIAGKGHEDYQLIGQERLSFSDIECAQKVMSAYQPKGGAS